MKGNKTVVVGMSGGVDSSVAAWLLKDQGYNVIGVTMRVGQGGAYETGGGDPVAIQDARRVADTLDIPHYVTDFQKEFQARVIDYFVSEYAAGRTPNPCVVCNRYVKWESLLREGRRLGADYIATGHYARVVLLPETGRWTLSRSAAAGKDQTYALYGLTQAQLSQTLMPAGGYVKEEIRRIAASLALNVADKPDSQEICFVTGDDYAGYIMEYTGRAFPAGRFVDVSGNTLGTHKGIIHYTVGQRKGLGLSFSQRMYVKAIDAARNEVVLAGNELLLERALIAGDVNFMGINTITTPVRAAAKIRYGQTAQPCTINVDRGMLRVAFDEPQRAVTPGQAVVAYDEGGDYVLCGGVICSACTA